MLNTPAELIREFPRLDRPDLFVQARVAGENCLAFQGVNTVVAKANTVLSDEDYVTVSIDFVMSQGAQSIGVMVNGADGVQESAVALVNTYADARFSPRLTVFFADKLSASLPKNAVVMRNLDLEYGVWHRLTLDIRNQEIRASVTRADKPGGQAAGLNLLELSLQEAPMNDWRPSGVSLRFYRSPQGAGAGSEVAVSQVAFK